MHILILNFRLPLQFYVFVNNNICYSVLGDILQGKVFVRLQLSCQSPVEFAFYASRCWSARHLCSVWWLSCRQITRIAPEVPCGTTSMQCMLAGWERNPQKKSYKVDIWNLHATTNLDIYNILFQTWQNCLGTI